MDQQIQSVCYHRPDPGAVDYTSKGDVITRGELAINLGDGTIRFAMGSRRQDDENPSEGILSRFGNFQGRERIVLSNPHLTLLWRWTRKS